MFSSSTIYGDSVLKGITLNGMKYVINREPENAFTERSGVSVRNVCRFGFTIEKGLELIKKDLQIHGPSEGLTFIEYGGNDCDYHWDEISEHPEAQHSCHTPLDKFVNLYHQIIQMLKEAGAHPVAVSLVPINSERYFDWFCQNGASPDKVMEWLGEKNAIYRWQEKYSMEICRIAEQEHIPILDLRSTFLGEHCMGKYLSADGIHPSKEGQALIWRTIEMFVSKYTPVFC